MPKPCLMDASGDGGVTHSSAMGRRAVSDSTATLHSFKRELLGMLESHEFCMVTTSHWWSVNHHVPEPSQALDLSQYIMARCLDFSCQQLLLPDHPKQYPPESTKCAAGSFWRFLHLQWQAFEIQTLSCIYLLH